MFWDRLHVNMELPIMGCNMGALIEDMVFHSQTLESDDLEYLELD